MSMTSLRSRLSFLKGLAPSAATRARFSGSSREPPAGALGDLRVTVRASPPGTPPWYTYSSRSEHPQVISLVRPTGRPAFHSVCHPWIGCRSQHRGMGSRPLRMKVPSGVVATATPDPELTTMLARAAVSIGLEVNRPPSPEPSQLDDWFLGAGRGSHPHSVPVSPFLTTLDGRAARGNAGIPQVERAVAVHLCP